MSKIQNSHARYRALCNQKITEALDVAPGGTALINLEELLNNKVNCIKLNKFYPTLKVIKVEKRQRHIHSVESEALDILVKKIVTIEIPKPNYRAVGAIKNKVSCYCPV